MNMLLLACAAGAVALAAGWPYLCTVGRCRPLDADSGVVRGALLKLRICCRCGLWVFAALSLPQAAPQGLLAALIVLATFGRWTVFISARTAHFVDMVGIVLNVYGN